MTAPACPWLSTHKTSIPYQEPCSHGSSPNHQFAQIQRAYPSLSSTGCTSKFCQSGRMKHTDEERVGRNQLLDVVLQDAADFLYQARQEGVFASDDALKSRTEEVFREIRKNAIHARYTAVDGASAEATHTSSLAFVGGLWTQTSEELEFGIRQAWKHSRKCIMRSEYKDLKLCDLRHVKTSAAMGTELVSALETAFDAGNIHPTVFVFPPRGPDERGPMIWNSNLLSFAGYIQEDGSVLGDPMNVQLTKSIIELGWKPPAIRTKWDVLPMVTMAQGHKPVITELPPSKFPLVSIQHPKHRLAFEKLGLRWVPAPVLSRLGFSIGGVQYTATPFIGWFMDAEIGVRNLVDPFRYNVLPELIKKMGLCDDDLADLPDFERLALLSRAQAELNYAVYWSFAKSRVRMIDSLAASELFSRFDDEHLAEHGFRLPSDPYWLAPPQGSLIPVWHRGGSPNYQPKPMVCHHVQDPVKAWQREQGCAHENSVPPQNSSLHVDHAARASLVRATGRIFVGFCSSGTVGLKLSKKLHNLLLKTASLNPSVGGVMPIQPLNKLRKVQFGTEDRLIIVASNTKKGEMPQNGVDFLKALEANDLAVTSVSFAIFGNGSRDYPGTFNQVASVLDNLMEQRGAVRFFHPVHADTATENPPWSALEDFRKLLVESLLGIPPTPPLSDGVRGVLWTKDEDAEAFAHVKQWFRANAKIKTTGGMGTDHRMKLVSLDIGTRSYAPMSYISVLPPNPEAMVQTFLQNLDIDADERLAFAENMTAWDFFHLHVDLEAPIKSINWTSKVPLPTSMNLTELAGLPSFQAATYLPKNWRGWLSLRGLCRSIPSIRPRKYSIASDYDYMSTVAETPNRSLELLVQHHAGGKFSDRFLSSIRTGTASVACRIEPAPHLHPLATSVSQPLVLFCTGSGIAPARSLLQHRIARLRSAAAAAAAAVSLTAVSAEGVPNTPPLEDQGEHSAKETEEETGQDAPIMLLAGHKSEDTASVRDVVAEAHALGLLDVMHLVPSGAARRRAQDIVLLDDGVRQKVLDWTFGNGGMVFACARPEAEEDFRGNLGALLGVADVRDVLGERYAADVFQAAS